MMISCPEEIAFRMRYINAAQLQALAAKMGDTHYGQYLRQLLIEKP
jgi:glucose-1-phosphate thymidylyltransferase